MNTFTTTPKPLADKTAMGLSSLCMLHCLALPALLAIYPSALAVALTDELFHTAMVFLAIPIVPSLYPWAVVSTKAIE